MTVYQTAYELVALVAADESAPAPATDLGFWSHRAVKRLLRLSVVLLAAGL